MVLGHGSRTRLLTCRLSTDRHHIRTPAHKAPWVSRTTNAISSTNRESLPLPRSTLSTRLSRIFIHKMVGRLSQGPGDAPDRCLPVCELSGGADCTMRRVLRAILLALCTLASLSIRDAIAARAAVGQCKSYANAHHCQYDRRNKSCVCQ